MFFEKKLVVSVAVGSAILAVACSDNAKDGASAKHDTEAACEHINDVCASTQGFQKQDCSSSNANYEKLNASDKAKADAVLPCVMATKSCQPAIACVSPASNDSTGSANDKTTPTHDTQDACEHINQVCANEQGFQKQDCSSSNADYGNLSDADKQAADAIVPCVMGAESCKTAFQCLKTN